MVKLYKNIYFVYFCKYNYNNRKDEAFERIN